MGGRSIMKRKDGIQKAEDLWEKAVDRKQRAR
jgi:hypothetical protein